MSNPLNDIGIAKGDETPVREITAPQEGDDYILSYYKMIRAIEQNTVYIEPTQEDLPDQVDADWALVGIAETQAEKFDGDSVHLYDGNNWVDTFKSIDDFVGTLEDRISDNETAISEYESRISDNDTQINENKEQIRELNDNIGRVDVHNGDESLQTQIDNLYKKIDNLQADVDAASYLPTITEYPTEVKINQAIQIKATILNGGRDSGAQDILLKVDGTVVDSENTVELEVNESREISLEWTPDEDDAGRDVRLEVETDDESDSRSSHVLAPAEFIIDGTSVSDEIDNAASTTISSDIKNIGELTGEQEIELDIDGSTVDTRFLELDPDQSDDVALDWGGTDSPGDYDVTITTEDETKTDGITVLEPASFEVQTLDVPDEVAPDDAVEISATIENNGEMSGDKGIELDIDGSTVDTSSLELDPDQSGDVALDWGGTDSPGDYDAMLRTEDETKTDTTQVLEPANFDIQRFDVPDEVAPGDAVEISATIENNGEMSGGKEIELDIDGSTADTSSLKLDPDQSDEVDLDWAGTNSPGDYDVTITTEDDTKADATRVLEPASFKVQTLDVPDGVAPGDAVEISATIENNGEMSGGKEIELDIDGSTADTSSLKLDPDQSDEVDLDWAGTNSPGDYDVMLTTEDETKSGATRVLEPATFEVQTLDVPDEVAPGDAVEISASIENNGEMSGGKEIELDIDGSTVDASSLELDPNQSDEVALDWSGTASPGDYDVTITTEDDAKTDRTRVLEPASFDIQRFDVPDEIELDDTVEISAAIENNGEMIGDQDVLLNVDGTRVDSANTVELAANESREVSLEWTPDEDDAGTDVGLELETDDESDSRSSYVLAPAEFVIDETGVPDKIESGDSTTIAPTIRNIGEVTGEQEIELDIDGLTDSRTLKLDPWRSDDVEFEWNGTTSTGEYDVTIKTKDDTNTDTISVLEPPNFGILRFDIPDEVAPDDAMEVSTTVENNGEMAGDKEVELDIDGSTVDTSSLELDPDQSNEVDLDWGGTDSPGDYDVTITTEDETKTNTTRVLEPASFEIERFDVPDEAVSDGTVEISATIKNVGEIEGEVTAELQENTSSTGPSEDLVISANDRNSVEFDWETPSTPGTYQLTVQAGNDSASKEVWLSIELLGSISHGFSEDPGPSSANITLDTGSDPNEVRSVEATRGWNMWRSYESSFITEQKVNMEGVSTVVPSGHHPWGGSLSQLELDVSDLDGTYYIRYHFYYTVDRGKARPESHLVVSDESDGNRWGDNVRHDYVRSTTGASPTAKLDGITVVPE